VTIVGSRPRFDNGRRTPSASACFFDPVDHSLSFLAVPLWCYEGLDCGIDVGPASTKIHPVTQASTLVVSESVDILHGQLTRVHERRIQFVVDKRLQCGHGFDHRQPVVSLPHGLNGTKEVARC
jgi:hypothetical protein